VTQSGLFKPRATFLYEPRSGGLVREAALKCPHPLSSAVRTGSVKPRHCGACRHVSTMHSRAAEAFSYSRTNGSGDHLDFRASLLGQTTTGTVDVAEDHVRLEVQLPWLLSMLANKAKALVEKQGKLMLEKPVKPMKQS
jgi:hypothetical protein